MDDVISMCLGKYYFLSLLFSINNKVKKVSSDNLTINWNEKKILEIILSPLIILKRKTFNLLFSQYPLLRFITRESFI